MRATTSMEGNTPMAPTSPSSKNSPAGHYIDIHPSSWEEDTVGDSGGDTTGRSTLDSQFSLEDMFSKIMEETNRSRRGDDRRTGKSFGGFSHGGGEHWQRRSFSMFRTRSAMLPRFKEEEMEAAMPETFGRLGSHGSMGRSVPNAGRYFAALKGPELDQIKDSEETLLPKDEKWPFLLRFPIGCFGICLGLSSQAILWGALATSPATRFLHIPTITNTILWHLAAAALAAIALTYALKCAFYFEAVRREYHHPVRVNFFFAPWVVCMFLAIGAPPAVLPRGSLHPAVWCAFMVPVFVLELKIYGQWFSGGHRRLSKVANPSSHLSVVGNFVGAMLAAKVGWKESAKFFWAVGAAHYLVVFVTLYQRLPSTVALPRELHPVYSMFIAAPSSASVAWQTIHGEFDGVSRTCYFVALFLYLSLLVRINLFRGFRFSVAWWAYTFPMSTASFAAIKYAEEEPRLLTKGLATVLWLVSSAMVTTLVVLTLLHAFLWRSLFPNDLAIAITKKKSKGKGLRKRYSMSIGRWTKKSPLWLVSSFKKGGRRQGDTDQEERISG